MQTFMSVLWYCQIHHSRQEVYILHTAELALALILIHVDLRTPFV
jgi:hypothetical protein